MGKGHNGKVAVITGAALGIGRAYALRMAEEGVKIAIADIGDTSEAVALVEKQGGTVKAYKCDVSSRDSVMAFAGGVIDDFGQVDILINNAGIYPNQPFGDYGFEEWRRVMSINLDSLFLTAEAFVPGMKERGWGRIVNTASSTYSLPIPNYVHYIASKGGVVGFTRGLATDLAAFGITVNAVSPSIVATPGTVVERGITEERFQAVANMQAIKRVEQPEDLVGTVAFLTSDDAAFITGQSINVDGGWVRT
jgi:NAD(P)-dependent dehydrogenase (short-subunit alcohol dehydrogenase family)